ncbi:MAG: FG-GAP-like repeat-containing protein, partial [Candidatus Latescibacteria bacterium]|nr:FG-GAP-like repeat-containing protein [Candidatus Latescibacterota bacterium]
MRVFGILVALMCVPVLVFAETEEEALWRHRNLGKAFYENSATQYDAVGEFKKALELAPGSAREQVNYGLALMRAGQEALGIVELAKAQQQDPSIPHTWFNLGIAYKRQSQYDKAVEQLEGMLRLVPDEAITHYNLGVLYKLNKRNDLAVVHFEKAAELDRNLAGPHFQLATAYRQAKRMDDAKQAMATFRRIKSEQAGAAVTEDLEWSFYSEIYEIIDPSYAQDTGPKADLTFESQVLSDNVDGLTILDANGDQVPDLLVWSKEGIRLFLSGKTETVCALEDVQNVVSIEPGDFDNDGAMDLCVILASGTMLYRNNKGAFEIVDASLSQDVFHSAVWVDYDHDYDSDLFLLGNASALYRNNGTAGFSDLTEKFPFVEGEAIDGVQFDLIADTQGRDLAVVYANRSGVLYRDRLAGKYEAQELIELNGTQVSAYDFNNDGWTDLVGANSTLVLLLVNDQNKGVSVQAVPNNTRGPIAFADFENRAVAELIANDSVYRNQGMGQFAGGKKPEGFVSARSIVSADFDADGKIDLVVLETDGKVKRLRNTTRTKNWLRVGLQGVKNLVLAPGAEIEVKAGTRYQKKIYQGLPLLFGLGEHAEADAVRITWPNGLIQNETKQTAGQLAQYKEAQRLSGSCPMIFTWNGSEFEFITDVLGVAPLGASAGDGEYFPVDHDEYVQILGESLVAKDGKYLIRITEELREVAYLDAIKLIAVDHHKDVDLFTNDKFKGPPFPEFRLFGAKERIYPISARDHMGNNVLQKLLVKDQTYPDGFVRDYAGVAKKHFLDLDFGNVVQDGRAIMVLSGWVDWADGSTFLGMGQQSPEGLVLPYLQVKNAQNEWETVIEDMGIPAGKPKTIVVDLSGMFLSASREVRIVTNLCVYWDQIFLGEEPEAPSVHLTDMLPASVDLGFRGFSEVVVHPERKQPERFIYSQLRSFNQWNWNPTSGLYTRFGDVKTLLSDIDD